MRAIVWVAFGVLGTLVACEAGDIETSERHLGGLLPDDPAWVASVPFAQAEEAVSYYRRARCGDKVCNGSETCGVCASDCGACPPPPPACGNGTCAADETCSSCDADCGVCPPPPQVCGDAVCNGSETCSSCPADCGACPALPAAHLMAPPPPDDQGNEGACVAFATAHARAIEQYYRSGATSYSASTNVFSPEYIYNQVKFGDCATGTAMQPALDLLVAQGVATWEVMPYDDSNGCSLLPTAVQQANAAGFKIQGYAKVEHGNEAVIKTLLASNRPVIFNALVCNEVIAFRGPGQIWGPTTCVSGSLPHAMLLTGYDDAKHAYRFLNSWGADWGDGGSAWLDYGTFVEVSSFYVYILEP